MSQPHPGSELSNEQLIHALARALDSNSSSERDPSELELREIPDFKQDLTRILQVIRAVKRIHFPINRLPPEILSEVLQHRDCEKDLVAATHVCKYWRSTLIFTPSLWTLNQFWSSHDLDRTLTYLERSKSTTIDVEIYLKSVQDYGVLQHFAPRIPKTRSFTIRDFNESAYTTFLLLCQPVPFLEHLTIDWYLPIHSEYSLDNFLNRQAPLLRSVTITGVCPLLRYPFQLPSLTNLNLDLQLLKDMVPVRISSLFGLCSGCPLLQKACIMFGPDHSPQRDVPLGQTVSLDSLVELVCTYSTCDPFIPLLNLPRLKRLSITVSNVEKLVDLLPHNGHAILSGTTFMFHHYLKSQQQIKLSGNGVNTSFHMCDNQGETTAGLLEYIPLRQIEYLKYKGSCISADFPFPLFENLTTFEVTLPNKRTAAQVLRLLGASFPSPSLREIVYNYPFSKPASFMKTLIQFARKRRRGGYKLEVISLVGHGTDPVVSEGLKESARVLRGYVGKLQVGGEVYE